MRNLTIKAGAFNQRIFEVVDNRGGNPEKMFYAQCGYRDRSCSPDCMFCSIDWDNLIISCQRADTAIGHHVAT